MKPKITLIVKTHCGQTRWYPGCAYSKAVAECMKRRSFSQTQLNIFKKLDFNIEYIKEG